MVVQFKFNELYMEFKVSLIYRECSRTASAIQKKPVLKNQTKKREEKREEEKEEERRQGQQNDKDVEVLEYLKFLRTVGLLLLFMFDIVMI